MDSKLENNDTRPILDISYLKEVGLKRIGELSGNIWTDYNATDPGITILEVLCYAILDLGYRMTFDIRDLLTEEGQTCPNYCDTFHEPYQVLPSSPITINDYRKLILENIDGIRNVWLKAKTKNVTVSEGILKKDKHNIAVKGFYDVYLDCIDYSKRKKVKKDVETLLHRNRNLCEDFDSVLSVAPLYVNIEAEIEIKPDFDYNRILQEIIKRLSEYISPDLRLYSLDEMLQKGKAVSDIFTGPLPKSGYVDMDEVEDIDDNNTLYISDMINIIMHIEGVVGVRHLNLFVDNKEDLPDVNIENYKISLEKSSIGKRVFRLSDKKQLSMDESEFNKIVFLLDNFRFEVKNNKKQTGNEIPQDETSKKTIRYTLGKDLSRNRELDKYYSIQNDFPAMYLVGRENISDSESDLRKAQRLQMKGYLMFFDQLLADFLMRLNNVKYTLSYQKPIKRIDWKKYLHHVLTEKEIDDLESLVDSNYTSKLQSDVSDTNLLFEQKNKALNHLLARFDEDFVSFSIMQYVSYGKNINIDKHQLIQDKSDMLKQLPSLGYRRAVAIDYKSDLCKAIDSDYLDFYNGNYCSVERKLYMKLGIQDYDPKKNLHPEVVAEESAYTVFVDNRKSDYREAFGLHIYEHNLLLPKDITENNFLFQYKDGIKDEYAEDPYSMKATVVLPGWLNIVQNHQFRTIVENAITEELPAHIAAKICWIDPLQMHDIEKAYTMFLEEKKKNRFDKGTIYFIDKLSELRNIYLPTKLYRSTAKKGTLLGYSSLGERGYKWIQKKNTQKI